MMTNEEKFQEFKENIKIELENANAPMCVGADAMGGVASTSPAHFVAILALIASLSAL